MESEGTEKEQTRGKAVNFSDDVRLVEDEPTESTISRKTCLTCGLESIDDSHACPSEQIESSDQRIDGREPIPFADRYQILSCIGSGGMGAIYLAKHTLMNRMVALKLLLPHKGANPSSLARFQQEAQAASQLSHPNIVSVFDFGVSEEGIPYLAMEYIDGMSLDRVIKENGPLDLAQAVHIFTQACDALEDAHEHGVIHRDLKPSNIIITNTGTQQDLVKIVDFGIAKLAQTENEDNVQLTMTGEVVGSPPYMSPEQCLGQNLDRRSDIYSMGCVLYEALAGSPPFKAATFFEIASKHLKEMPANLSSIRRDIRNIQLIETVVFKALAKDPSHRFKTMLELKGSLEQAGRGQTGGWLSRAKSLWKWRRVRKDAKAKSTSSTAVLLILLCMVVVTAVARIWLTDNKNQESPRNAAIVSDPVASWNLIDVEGQKEFNSGNYDAALAKFESAVRIAETFAKTDRLALSLEKQALLFHILKKTDEEKKVDARLAELKTPTPGRLTDDEASHQSGVLEGMLAILPADPSKIDRDRFNELARQMNMLAGHYLREGQPERAKQVLDKLVPRIKQVLGTRHERMAVAMSYLGEALADSKKYGAAEAVLREGLVIREQVFDPTDPKLAKGLIDLGRVLVEQDKFEAGQRLYERALAIYSASKHAERDDVAYTCQKIGWICWQQHKYAAAESYYKRALELFEKSNNHESIAYCLSHLAQFYAQHGDTDRAEKLFVQSLSRAERELGRDNEDLVWYLEQSASFYFGRRDFSSAEPIYLRALAIRQRTVPPHERAVVDLLHNVAGVYYSTGRPALAEPLCRQKLAISERAERPDLNEQLSSIDGIALMCHAQGRQSEARVLAQRALATLLRIPASEYEEVDHEFYTVAKFYFSRSDYDKTEDWLKRTISYSKIHKGTDDLDTAQALDDLAHLYWVQGRTSDEALPSREAVLIVEKNPYVKPLQTAQIVENYAFYLRQAGRHSEASKYDKRAREIRLGVH